MASPAGDVSLVDRLADLLLSGRKDHAVNRTELPLGLGQRPGHLVFIGRVRPTHEDFRSQRLQRLQSLDCPTGGVAVVAAVRVWEGDRPIFPTGELGQSPGCFPVGHPRAADQDELPPNRLDQVLGNHQTEIPQAADDHVDASGAQARRGLLGGRQADGLEHFHPSRTPSIGDHRIGSRQPHFGEKLVRKLRAPQPRVVQPHVYRAASDVRVLHAGHLAGAQHGRLLRA